jgi:CheY-like chemotaxis protein
MLAIMTLKKILVVEDHPDLAELTQMQLDRIGLMSLVATSGPEALRKAQEEKPDLILLDVRLPGISGLEVGRRLKANPSTRSIPILAVTAKVMPGDWEKCLESGCDGYLAKPFLLHQLKGEIQKLLR